MMTALLIIAAHALLLGFFRIAGPTENDDEVQIIVRAYEPWASDDWNPGTVVPFARRK